MLVGLQGETHRIRGFSRGMKQRLGIAQALLGRPKLLICDEPTSALDPVGRKEILDILLAAREQTTVLFSTHILSDVERICTDVALLDDGVIQIQGTIDQIKAKGRSEGYLLELEDAEDARQLLHSFDGLRPLEGDRQSFRVDDSSLYPVLDQICRLRIPVRKLERIEPTLESLFMEVVDK